MQTETTDFNTSVKNSNIGLVHKITIGYKKLQKIRIFNIFHIDYQYTVYRLYFVFGPILDGEKVVKLVERMNLLSILPYLSF